MSYLYIQNPKNGRNVNIFTKTGQTILNNYIYQLGGHNGPCALNANTGKCRKSDKGDNFCEVVLNKKNVGICKRKADIDPLDELEALLNDPSSPPASHIPPPTASSATPEPSTSLNPVDLCPNPTSIDEFITITFGEVSETHVGMRKEGDIVPVGKGLSPEMLHNIGQWFSGMGAEIELIDLTKLLSDEEKAIGGSDYVMEPKKTTKTTVGDAHLLIIRKGVDILSWFVQDSADLHSMDESDTKIYNELKALEWDKKALNRGKVVNKQLRHNLNFGKEEVKQNVEDGIGTVMKFDDVPNLQTLHKGLMNMLHKFNPDFVELRGEGNRYYDKLKCCINYHGDGERRIVIASRFGATMPIRFQWYHKSKPVGKNFVGTLNHGDMYFMSEKAVGTDWHRKLYLTLRHAAGCYEAMRK